MKPTLRSFFSGAAPCAKASVIVLTGRNALTAASAVEAPTARRSARRVASRGKTARMTALSITRVRRKSSFWATREASAVCSASLAWRPQAQPRRRFGSNGLSKVAIVTSSVRGSRHGAFFVGNFNRFARAWPLPASSSRKCRFRAARGLVPSPLPSEVGCSRLRPVMICPSRKHPTWAPGEVKRPSLRQCAAVPSCGRGRR